MKKNDLLKMIGICFIIFVFLSWIIPTGSYSTGEYVKGDFSTVGLADLFYYPVITFGTFIQYGLLFLVIGGFYGVINETGVYKKMVDALANKFKKKEKLFLILTISVLALVSSLTNLQLTLFLVVPILVAVFMSLGYDKMTSFVSTIGSIIVGSISTLYGINNAYINALLNLDVHNNVLAKLLLLVILVFLLIMFVLKKSNLKERKLIDLSKEEIPLLDNNKKSKKSFLPLSIMLVILMVFLFISMYNWNYNLGITYFSDIHENLMNISIKEFPIFKNLIGDVNPFGYWDTYEMSFVLIITSLLIGWVYSIKISDVVKSFAEGAKKMLKVAFFATLSNIIFTLMISTSDATILNTINNYIFKMSEGINIGVLTLFSLIGPLFYNNFYYLSNIALTPFVSIYTDASLYGVVGIIFQGMYSILMLILPTSLVLVAGLSMLDISWKDWFKYIWKYLIWSFIIILIVAILLFILI